MQQNSLYDQAQILQLIKALANATRLELLNQLAVKGHCVCGELVENLPQAQATVSQHLKVLKEASLVQGTIDGPSVCYCLDPKGLERAQAMINAAFEQLKSGQSCC